MSEFPFSIHPRRNVGGDYTWYVQFKNDDGSYLPAKSTRIRGKETGKYVSDSIGNRKPIISRRREAVAWAFAYLQNGGVVTKERVTFAGYADGFFGFGGAYIKEKRMRGHSVSDAQLKNQQGYIKHFLTPFFGSIRLTKIDAKMIAGFQRRLLDGDYPTAEGREPKPLHGGTVNHVSTALGIVLRHAERDGLIQSCPTIERVAQRSAERGVLSPTEVKKLFALEWNDYRYKVANMLAATTGLRRGEILALRRCDIRKDHLRITGSWDDGFQRRKGTKTERPRNVPITPEILDHLIDMMRMSPFRGPETYVFYSERVDRPMPAKGAQMALYEALKAIKIDEEKRKARGLTFHSWRHYFNSWLINAGVPIEKVQSITGHSTRAMSEHYYHADDYADVIKIQQGLTLVKGGAA